MLKALKVTSLLASIISASTAIAETDKRPPNIIVIMADDLGMMDLHSYGNDKLDTPMLDRFASQGMRFTNAYAASPVCSPTRGALMTGQTPARLLLTNHAPGNPDGFAPEGAIVAEPETIRNLPLRYVTIAERLSGAGYATVHIGKWHLSHGGRGKEGLKNAMKLRPEHQGFDLNIGGWERGGPASYFAPYKNPMLPDREEGEYLPARLADEAIQYIKQNKDKPFYMNYCPYSVHYPMQARPELIEKYEKRKGPGIKDPVYAAMIEGMDAELGRFLKALDDEGLSENTLVIFKSDNGGYNGDNRPLKGYKGMLFEGGIRIPFIAKWPGMIKAGSVCDTPVITMDCFPTLLETAAIPLPADEPIDGLSLMPLLTGQDGFERDAIYFHYPNYAFHKRNRLGSVIREGHYKLIKRYDDHSLELYDLSKDIGEKKNLAKNKPIIAKRLEKKLDAWLKETGAKMPIHLPKN